MKHKINDPVVSSLRFEVPCLFLRLSLFHLNKSFMGEFSMCNIDPTVQLTVLDGSFVISPCYSAFQIQRKPVINLPDEDIFLYLSKGFHCRVTES